jgi:septum formation protein
VHLADIISLGSGKMLVLASTSPRRGMLLEEAGFSFTRVRAEVSEELPFGVDPEWGVKELALRKAQAGLECWLGSGGELEDIILGADTIVVLDNQILGKPATSEEAEEMLCALSGRKHAVYTGVALVDGTGHIESEAIRTEVFFRALTREEIQAYVITGEPMDKAGAYGIQGKASAFVDHYEGSLSNVIGLPMEHVIKRLSVWGIYQENITLHEVRDGLSSLEGSPR